MASKALIARENKRVKMVAKYAAKREQLKSEGNWLELDRLPKNSSKVRLHNRCQITGRPKGFVRFFGVSRNVFRELASYGKLPGVTKSSW